MTKCQRHKGAAMRGVAERLTALTRLADVHGFSVPAQLWQGRNKAYSLKHSCGILKNAVPFEIESVWRKGGTGCDWCDRTGRLGSWRGFVELMAGCGWTVTDPLNYVGEHSEVEFSCRRHPGVGTLKARRDRLRGQLAKNSKRLPTCPQCRAEIEAQDALAYDARKVEEILRPFHIELLRHGMELVEWKWKGTVHADGTFSKYLVKCQKCNNERTVTIHDTMAKMKKRVQLNGGCPTCARKKPLSKPRAKTRSVVAG